MNQHQGSQDDEELLLTSLDSSRSTLEQETTVVLDLAPSTPLWAYALLIAAVFAVSSAAVTFAMIAEVPPITLAAWRLQLTSIVLGIGGGVQYRGMPPADRHRMLQEARLLAASGTCLCFHFGLWVLSVETTSLAHSLLFVSATPLFLAGGAWLLRQPISAGELAGAGLGLLGAVLLATAAARSDAQVTVGGDLAALAASLCFVGYLLVGQRLRKWMPAFVYAFSVTSLAALLLTLGALLFEGASLAAAGMHGVFGWAASPHYLPYVLYLALGPGIVGHTGFNTLLRYMDPLLISLACNMEPLIGSLLGWALGLVAPPGAWTYVGGGLVLASTCVVSLASHCREKRQAAADKGGGAATPALGGSRGLGHAAAAPPAEGGGELLGLRAAHGDSPSGGPRSKAPAAAPAGPPPSAV